MKILLSLGIFTAYALCSGIGLILLKLAMTQEKLSLSRLRFIMVDIRFLAGFSLYVCGFLLWMYILSKFDLNVAFPIAMAFFFLISGLGSYFIIGEAFTWRHIFGTVLCFLGIVLIGLK